MRKVVFLIILLITTTVSWGQERRVFERPNGLYIVDTERIYADNIEEFAQREYGGIYASLYERTTLSSEQSNVVQEAILSFQNSFRIGYIYHIKFGFNQRYTSYLQPFYIVCQVTSSNGALDYYAYRGEKIER